MPSTRLLTLRNAGAPSPSQKLSGLLATRNRYNRALDALSDVNPIDLQLRTDLTQAIEAIDSKIADAMA